MGGGGHSVFLTIWTGKLKRLKGYDNISFGSRSKFKRKEPKGGMTPYQD